eukprot:322457_1
MYPFNYRCICRQKNLSKVPQYLMHLNCYKTKKKNTTKNTSTTPLSAYINPPDVEVNIDDFESCALSRLTVLRSIELQNYSAKQLSTHINSILIDNELNTVLLDQLSHYILRLCFCKTSDIRHWFVKMETKLFEARYMTAKLHELKIVQTALYGDTKYDIYSKAMIINNKNLNGKHPIPYFTQNKKVSGEKYLLPYYKVPFVEILPLIGARKVLLSEGFAYVPKNLFYKLVSNRFKQHLHDSLETAQRALACMSSNQNSIETLLKINHMVNDLHNVTNITPYKIDKHKNICAKDVNKLNNKHYPLCMQSSAEHLNIDGHLKHGGRMQLGLFLKGIGLSLPESLIYWRKSLKSIGYNTFDKQYSYNIKHNYGKEGRRIDYRPYSCNKIISCTPNNGDYHGCPFKTFGSNKLKQYLLSNLGWKISEKECDTIIKLKIDNHYQLCCKHYFAIQHKEILTKNW